VCETVFDLGGLGPKVHGEILNEYPSDLLEDERRLAYWVWDLCDRYGDRLLIRVIDPQSGLGFYKCLRHWVRRYPAFIIGGRKRYVGWDREELEAVLQETMESQ
jgi:hypothetical protein